VTAQGNKSVFISYRRRDTLPLAMYIGDAIKRSFVNVDVFVDIDQIEIGDRWPERIREALEKASVLIVLIGPLWLTAPDKYGRRRLDNPEDWVRREIELAFEKKLLIIPVLFSGAELPEKEGLPHTLAALLDTQASRLREDIWQDDVARLVKRLRGVGFEVVGQEVTYPPLGKVNEHKLSDEQIEAVLKELPEWRLEVTEDVRGGSRRELVRNYVFGSFQDALHFMATAARRINKLDHHPDWRNLWCTVLVRLATWDIGHRPSAHDVKLAKYLEKLYNDYNPDGERMSKQDGESG
jgi:pterin-4a-carbinolamine dehydratase